MKQTVTDNISDLPFRVNQVVYLEYQGSRLYGEVIQLIPHRQICWFRPVCLVMSVEPQTASPQVSVSPRSSEAEVSNSNSVKGSNFPHELTCSSENTPHYYLEDCHETSRTQLIDLQLGSDLLWPISLFQPALDVDVINHLAQLSHPASLSEDRSENRHYLNKFIRQFWQVNQDKF